MQWPSGWVARTHSAGGSRTRVTCSEMLPARSPSGPASRGKRVRLGIAFDYETALARASEMATARSSAERPRGRLLLAQPDRQRPRRRPRCLGNCGVALRRLQFRNGDNAGARPRIHTMSRCQSFEWRCPEPSATVDPDPWQLTLREVVRQSAVGPGRVCACTDAHARVLLRPRLARATEARDHVVCRGGRGPR